MSSWLIWVHVEGFILNNLTQNIFLPGGTELLNVCLLMDITVIKWIYGDLAVFYLRLYPSFLFFLEKMKLIRYIRFIKFWDHPRELF